MRILPLISMSVAAGLLVYSPSAALAGPRTDKNRARCASYGFAEGTDAFANCVMKLSLQQDRPPDRETLIRRYRDRSMSRRGDDRYPVCTAGMMDNELDFSTGKWVGPSCQMAPD